jgi:diguanylate cyclase (GGDEF)-like protein
MMQTRLRTGYGTPDETRELEKLEESGLMRASEDGMNRSNEGGTRGGAVDSLTQMHRQSEHIRSLIQQSVAAVMSASAEVQHQFANSEPLSGVSQVLDHHAAATRQLHEADERLTALNQLLQGEVRERTLLDHQLAAAFEQEEGSRKAAFNDPLTGLSNRVLFYDRLEHGIAQASRHGWLLAVLFVDLNEFKRINDIHGHQTGDAVLRSIGLRLAHSMRHEDTVSRYGGDEFLCLLAPLHEQKHIAMIAAKILAAIQDPCEVCGRDGLVSLWVHGSIGISVFPKDGASVAELIRRADEAMYVAKKNKSGFAFAE